MSKSTYNKRKQNGVCVFCGLVKVINRTSCDICRELRRKRYEDKRRLRYKNKLRNNMCGRCNSKRENLSIVSCYKCWYQRIARDNFGSRKRWEEIKILLEGQNFICTLTGDKLIIGENTSLDHIIPKSRGGSNNLDNIQWVTKIANQMKFTQTISNLYFMCEKILKYKEKKQCAEEQNEKVS